MCDVTQVLRGITGLSAIISRHGISILSGLGKAAVLDCWFYPVIYKREKQRGVPNRVFPGSPAGPVKLLLPCFGGGFCICLMVQSQFFLEREATVFLDFNMEEPVCRIAFFAR